MVTRAHARARAAILVAALALGVAWGGGDGIWAGAPEGLQAGPGSAGAGPGRVGQARDRFEVESGTGRITGRVVAAATGRPIRRAQVRITGERVRGGRLASTDEDGWYEVPDLPGGRYNVTASKGGFVSIQFGQRHPLERGVAIEVSDAATRANIDFRLPPGGVITGAIVDEFGEPVAEALVQAMRYRFVGGERRLVPADRGTTNDIGEYRLFGLPPGDYVVAASLRPFRGFRDLSVDSIGYASTYYPGTPNAAEASRVSLAVGQHMAGVGFSLVPVAMARLSGRVMNSFGEPLANAFVGVVPDGGIPVAGMRNPGSRTARDGTFTIAAVPPGRYRLLARIRRGRGSGGRDAEFAAYVVTVMGGNIDNLVLTTAPGASMFGSVVADGGTVPSIPSRAVRLEAVSVESTLGPLGGAARASIGDDWSLELAGLWGARLIRAPRLPDGWMLERVMLGGTDITDQPVDFGEVDPSYALEVVLSSSTTEVTGTVHDAQGTVADYTVVVFVDSPDRWGYRSRFVGSARASEDGSFTIRGLPAERYRAIALPFVEQGAWTDPSFLERLHVAAEPFDLNRGGTAALALELAEPLY